MILLLLVVILLFGGVGYHWNGFQGGGIGLGGILLVLLVLYLIGMLPLNR